VLYVSTSAINSKKTSECVEKCAQITKNIELSGGCDYEEGLLAKLIGIRDRLGLNYLLHGYFPPPKGHFIMNFAENSKRTRAFIEEGAAYVEALNIPYYSVHAGFKKTYGLNKEILIDSSGNNEFTIGDIGESVSYFTINHPAIRLALENLYPNAGMDCCFMMHIEEITEILDRFPGIYLLLDLGHLKISSRHTGFNYAATVELLFEKYADRILELHLSENDGLTDRHWPIYTDSIQYLIVKHYAGQINKRGINVAIETRNSDFEEVSACFQLINSLIS
jgi:sugar phosphate isomerase/epimerase